MHITYISFRSTPSSPQEINRHEDGAVGGIKNEIIFISDDEGEEDEMKCVASHPPNTFTRSGWNIPRLVPLFSTTLDGQCFNYLASVLDFPLMWFHFCESYSKFTFNLSPVPPTHHAYEWNISSRAKISLRNMYWAFLMSDWVSPEDEETFAFLESLIKTHTPAAWPLTSEEIISFQGNPPPLRQEMIRQLLEDRMLVQRCGLFPSWHEGWLGK
jgi:hypothetical protein